jgi:single-strand DNA-binding protein
MDYVNRVELRGRLTKEPEMRYTPKGTAVTNASIATNRFTTVADGERKEFTEYHQLVAWQDLAKQLAELSKGDWVHVKGRIQSRSWEGQDGQKRRAFEVIVEEILPAESRVAAPAAPRALDELIS